MRRLGWALLGFTVFGVLEGVIYFGAPALYGFVVGRRLIGWLEGHELAYAAGGPPPFPDSRFDYGAGTWIPQERSSAAPDVLPT